MNMNYNKKNKKSKNLKKKNNLEEKSTITFLPIIEKPTDYEPDIFKACKEGKLTSVQWLLEKENEDKIKKIDSNNTPIHIASQNGHLSIVQYLIEKQNVDKDI